MRRQPVVVALVVGVLALTGLPAASAPAQPAAPVAPAVPGGVRSAAQPVDDGLTEVAKSTFVVDPDARQIHVSTRITLTNTKPDTRQGDVIRQHYFDRYDVPVLSEAANTRAQEEGGTPFTVDVVASDVAGQHWISFAQIALDPWLLYGQTRTIVLTYDLPYQAPRSPGLSRANDAVVMFPTFTPGDPGQGSLEVQLPSHFAVEVVGDPLDQQELDGRTVLTSGPIENPGLFTATVVATDDEQLISKPIEVEGRQVEVRAWPDDTDWATFIAEKLGAIMPALDELVGQPWPTERGLAVIETASPYAHGYAGWYDQVDHSISLGDELDPLVVAHELSHVWFNANLFSARWINEGFADEYAQTTMQQLGEEAPTATAPDRDGPGAVALDDWSTPSLLEQQDEATETYGYAAAWYLIDQIATEIGVDRLRDVVAAVADDRIPYVGDPEAEDVHGVADWRRLLDQLENVGGSQRATELFGRYVVADGEDRDALATRTAARQAYAGLVERGGEWTPPLALRVAMSDWKFDDAAAALIQANGVLDLRDDITRTLDGLDVGDLALEDTYEGARSLDEVHAEATATLDAAEALRDADAHLDGGAGLVGTIGLLGSGTSGRLDDAADELTSGDPEASLAASAAVEDDLDGATRNGVLRLAGLAVLLVLMGVGLRHRNRQHRRRQDDQAEIDQLEAMYAGRPADPLGHDALWRRMDPDHPN
jgi:hypothetical protein